MVTPQRKRESPSKWRTNKDQKTLLNQVWDSWHVDLRQKKKESVEHQDKKCWWTFVTFLIVPLAGAGAGAVGLLKVESGALIGRGGGGGGEAGFAQRPRGRVRRRGSAL